MVDAIAACVAARCANSGVAQPDWARGESAATVHSRAAHGHGGGGGGGSSKGAGDGGIPSELARVIKSVTAAVPGATIVLCSVTGGMNVPAKEAVEVKLIFHQVLCASIALAAPGQPAPLNLQLDSYEHAATNDAWGGSGSHQVFRRVSSLAMRALSYFDKRAGVWASSGDGDASSVASGSPGSSAAPAPALSHGGMVLEDLLLWLCLYRGLFSVPCYVTGTLLAWDPSTGFSLPPIYRNFKVTRKSAISCKNLGFSWPGRGFINSRIRSSKSASSGQECSRAQLRAAASSKDVSSIEAYHMHAVPVDMLDWCTNPDALVE
ncbi:hypothetical protein FOA52_008792 [Chlamydomonas sp. UWO 241]|nr:hypothetical protein FOA52_008792 [Chlamydomonas sp. UWO 241]